MFRTHSKNSSFVPFVPFVPVVALVALVAAMPAAAVPDVLTYAGSLRRGSVDADGTFAVVVSLFDAAEGGAPLFTHTDPSLAVTAGELIVDLGADPTNPLGDELLTSGELFLSITVDGEELTPRVSLSSVPFALQARFAEDSDSVGGLTADDIASLYTAGDGLAQNGTAFSLATNGVTSVHIVDGSITSVDIATGAVTSSHIANGAITGAHLAGASVTGANLAADAVTSAAIANDAVTSSELANDSVTSSELAANAVTSSEIANDAVTASEIADGTVGAAEIGVSAVGTSEIADGSVTAADLATDSVNASEIVNGAVTSNEIGSNAVGSDELAEGTVVSAHLANGILVFREAAGCGGSLTLTLDNECTGGVCGGQFNFPTPSGCQCVGSSSNSTGTVVCPNISVGRLVREGIAAP